MGNIFEELDRLNNILLENDENDIEEQAEKKIKEIPIHPDMKTSNQGVVRALDLLANYFYDLSQFGRSGGNLRANDDIELPLDDILSPMLKGKMKGQFQDKEFDKNKLIWDEKSELEKLKKEIDISMLGESDDEFDDFDYRDNDFGDDEGDSSQLDTSEMDSSGSGGSSSQSEKEKLQDAINDAIDKLRDQKNGGSQSNQQNGSQSEDSQNGDSQGNQQNGSQNGDSQGNQQNGGSQGNQQNGGSQGNQQNGSQNGGSQGNQQNGSQNGGFQGNQQNGGSQDSSQGGGGRSATNSGGAISKKDEMLNRLQNALNNGDEAGATSAIDDIKEGGDGSGSLAGERLGNVDGDSLSSDMKKSGVSDDEIKEMEDMAQKNTMEDVDEDEFKELQREVMKGLEKKCKKKGGSALAKTIVRNALKRKIDDEEWRKLLKIFFLFGITKN